jgi:hypothetical protein
MGQTLTISERRRQTTAGRIWVAGRYFLGSQVLGDLTANRNLPVLIGHEVLQVWYRVV